MLALIGDFLVAIAVIYLGIAHSSLQNHPLLQRRDVQISLSILLLSVVGGWFVLQKIKEDKQIEHEDWTFAKQINSPESYCAFLKKYPHGEFSDFAEPLCHSKVVAVETKSVEPVVPKPEIIPPPAKPDAVAPPAEPAIPEPVQPVATAPVETRPPQPVEAIASAPEEEWQTLDRYQVKGGLVKDTQTGLMWMRCSLGQTWDGSTCAGDAAKYKWEEAMKTPNDFSYAGYSDWRVPTHEELKTLVFCSSGKTKTLDDGRWECDGEYTKPTIKTDVFLNTKFDNWFWSSSPYAASSYYAWIVYFGNGYGNSGNKDDFLAVRLVRGGQ